MSNVSRREWMAGTGALCAALAAPAAGDAQLVYRHGDWKAEEFQELLHKTAHAKQVFDVTAINEGKFLNNIKNSLNGFEFGFGIRSEAGANYRRAPRGRQYDQLRRQHVGQVSNRGMALGERSGNGEARGSKHLLSEQGAEG